MYRPTDPQSDLFAAGFQLHPSAQRMLDREWAGKFRTHIFPLLLREEERLAVLYDPGNGRPNWSAARMMGLCVIQSWFRLTDRELERTLSFDIRVQHALDLRVEEAYLSRRSLSDFRLRLVTVDPKMEIFRALFDAVAKEAIEQLGLDVSRQRLDSTHVMSNIRSRGRADLFARALRRFVSQLQKEHPEGAGRLPKVVAQWYADDGEKSWFGKGGAKTALTKLAQWAVDLGFMFSTDAVVREWESYFLVTRLVAEFCVFEKAEEAPALEGDEKVQAAMPDQAAAPKTGATPAPAACPTGAERSGEADSGTAGGLASGTQGAGAAAETAGGPAAAGAEAELDNGQRSRGGRGGPAQPEGAAPKPADANGAEGEVNAASSAHPAPCEDGHERAGDPPAASAAPNPSPQVDEVLRRGRRGGNSLQSVSDPDAGYGNKGAGYSAHITETCGNEGAPEIITDFELRSAADNDWGKSTAVLERLVERDLAPRTMFADAGYPTPQSLIDAARLGVDLHAPVGRKGGDERFGLEAFVLAEDGTVAACPEGHVPLRHATRREPGCKEPELHAYFDGDTCRGCPRFESCPATGRATGQIHVRVEERIVARDMAIERQRSSKWWLTYAIRSGVEATMSELKRAHGLGRLRVRTGVRVAMRLALILTSCNIKRWLNGLPEPEATA